MSEKQGAMQHIGRYIVDEMVGEGAMADVYRAHDPEIDRTVAIKVLKDELCVDKEYMNRFLREAKAAGTISHPNIVTIYDVGRVDEKPYITMEFLKEETLEDVVGAGGTLPLKRVLRIGIQLARALDYAHKQGVVHRDIKPANILFMSDSDTIKVADFGIAHMSSSDEIHRTQAGTVMGTPRYMSPEQALGQDIDGRSDLFSVGVILYEACSGQKAFDAGTMTSLLLQITQDDPEPIKKVAPDLPIGMQRIISKLLNKKPEKRFQTGAELADALQRELDSVLEQEHEANRNKFVPLKVKWALGAGAGVAVVLIIAMFVVLQQQGNAIQRQVLDSGASLAKFIATDAAVPVLSEDWTAVEIDLKNASEKDTFEYLTITDSTGTVRAASDPSLVGKPYQPPADADAIHEGDGFTAMMVETDDGTAVFNFDTPITFLYRNEPKEIGRVYLGMSREGLDDVMGTTRMLMLALGLITIVSVVAMLYVFGGLLARPFRRLREAMNSLGAGDLDQRISDLRNDEIGELFHAFNEMADDIQQRVRLRGPDDAAADAPVQDSAPPPWADVDDSPVDDGTVVIGRTPKAQATPPKENQDDDEVEPNATVFMPPPKRG